MFKQKTIKELPKNKLFCYRKSKPDFIHDMWCRKISDNFAAIHILAKIKKDEIKQIRINPNKQLRKIKIKPEQKIWA